MSKNIIICLDGTGNQPGRNNSNVARLYRMLERNPGQQVAYYDPGVGTMGDPTYKTWIARKINKLLGMAFGRGLTKNLVEAYIYLMEHYEEGDAIFLFGFSRGAYSARALAAFIRNCGLFEKGSHNMIPYAMGLFLKKESSDAPIDERGRTPKVKKLNEFRSTYGRRIKKKSHAKDRNPFGYQIPIKFLGLFDTVKSYGWVRKPVMLPNESENASIETVRHAIAIDERRVSFRQMHWTTSKKNQDVNEVWFSGVHSDVGGGYPESESGLAKIALEWMVNEACAYGMKVLPFSYNMSVLGLGPSKTGKPERKKEYAAPDPTEMAHESLKGAWRLFQIKEKPRRTIKGEIERRGEIESSAKSGTAQPWKPLTVHQSVIDRLKAPEVRYEVPGQKVPAKGEYRPPNLPKLFQDRKDPNSPPIVDIERTRPAPIFPPDEAGGSRPLTDVKDHSKTRLSKDQSPIEESSPDRRG